MDDLVRCVRPCPWKRHVRVAVRCWSAESMKQCHAVLHKKTKHALDRCFKDRRRWDPVVLRYREAGKQIDVKHFSRIPQPVIRSSLCLCRLAELHCGGGQIVTTGAPQQFSVSKWKPTPTPTHRFIPDLAQHFYYLSVRFFSLLSVSVHVSLYTLPPSDNNHADISWYFFRFWKSNAWIINLSLYQHINTQTITQIQLLMLLFEWNCCYSSVILWTLISPFICTVPVLVLL